MCTDSAYAVVGNSIPTLGGSISIYQHTCKVCTTSMVSFVITYTILRISLRGTLKVLCALSPY